MSSGALQRRVGSNVRAARLRLGMSQEQFADHVGLNRTYVGGVERGERNLSLRAVERLAYQLDYDPLDLFSA